jgi:hypothetical protein
VLFIKTALRSGFFIAGLIHRFSVFVDEVFNRLIP